MDTVEAGGLERRVQTALETNQFRLHYQPQVERRTGRIVGAEALLRWHDPEAGLLAPGHFLPLLESTGLIVPVGEWVLRQAALDGQRWQRLGFPRMRIAVNLSFAQLASYAVGRRDFDTRVLRECCDFQFEVPAAELVRAPAAVLRALAALRSEGVDIAMQGFDARATICTRLWSLPVDTLKIAQAFVRRMSADPDGEVIVSSMVVLARAFRMGLIADGVERPDQVEMLARIGCEQMQGLAFSPAVPAARFERLLEGLACRPQPGVQRRLN
jgi:EAL domain-containing protein (putative c-di-GMP-specific phosphodiesterase class I)